MAADDTVAVVVPSYQRREYVLQAVRSVLRQTYANLQCIVVDNGPDDGTAQALASLGDPRVKTVRHEGALGAAGARNVGIEAASGTRWVAFLDSDDIWAPTKLERQIGAISANPPALLSATSSVVVDADLMPTRALRSPVGSNAGEQFLLTRRDLLHQLGQEQRLSLNFSTFMAPRDALLAAGGCDVNLRHGDDWDLVIRMAEHSPIAYVDLPLAVYRIWGAGQLSSDWRGQMKDNATVRSRYLPQAPPPTREERRSSALRSAWRNASQRRRLAAGQDFMTAAWLGRAPGQLAYAFGAVVFPDVTQRRLKRMRDSYQPTGLPEGWEAAVLTWLPVPKP